MTDVIVVDQPVTVAITEQQTTVIAQAIVEQVVIEPTVSSITVEQPLINVLVSDTLETVIVKDVERVTIETGIQGPAGESAKPLEIKTQCLAYQLLSVTALPATIYRAVIWHVVLVDTVSGKVRRSIIDATFNGNEVIFMEYAINGTRNGFYAHADLIGSNITLQVTNETANTVNVNAVLISDLTLF